MTVHKAKGLEFPIVILADIGCKLSQDEASRHLDTARGLCAVRIGGWAPLDLLEHNDLEARRDEAEGVRLAYVAATRARDLLVVPAVGDRPFQKGWVRPLNRALYPPVDRRQQPGAAPGCPKFPGKDTVLVRPEGMQADASTVRPGAYELSDTVAGESYTVVWWDPRVLDRPAEDPRGLRREELISKDAAAEDVRADRARYEQWRTRRAALQASGAEPSVTVLTASEFAHASAPATETDPSSIAIVDALSERSESTGRPSGRRFGILVHALLAATPLDATADAIRGLAEVQARLLGATDDERAAAAAIADRVLRHPIAVAARDARAAGRVVRREAPVSMMISFGVVMAAAPAPVAVPGQLALAPPADPLRGRPALVDGPIDLVFDEGAGWVVVDFKTDAEIADAESIYRRQVALYVDAMTRATGRSARGILLRV
jgi:ATP-dependent exoDNAse (exonuclease V) beta subunit